jgi:hypothetical protein
LNNIQRIPENRKLPFPASVYYFTYVVSTKFHDFKIVPPASPYIIIPPGGIIIYELAGGNISKKRNVVDPNIWTGGRRVVSYFWVSPVLDQTL